MKIHHIGYLVKNMKKSLEEFLKLGYLVEGDIINDDIRQISIVFLIKDRYRIELVSPQDRGSATGDLLKKIGNSPYHICYEVPCLDEAIVEFEKNGYLLTIEPQIAPAINNKRVAFLYNMHLGMIEILEVY